MRNVLRYLKETKFLNRIKYNKKFLTNVSYEIKDFKLFKPYGSPFV